MLRHPQPDSGLGKQHIQLLLLLQLLFHIPLSTQALYRALAANRDVTHSTKCWERVDHKVCILGVYYLPLKYEACLNCCPLPSVLSLVMESWKLWASLFALPLNHCTRSFWRFTMWFLNITLQSWIHWPPTRDWYLFLSSWVRHNCSQKPKHNLARTHFFHWQDTWLAL